jgi:hypothetical protein
MQNPLVEVLGNSLKDTAWVNGSDGSCLARFSKRFGMDIHRSATEQMEGGKQCLHCTHQPATKADWLEFIDLVELHHDIKVPENLISY